MLLRKNVMLQVCKVYLPGAPTYLTIVHTGHSPFRIESRDKVFILEKDGTLFPANAHDFVHMQLTRLYTVRSALC